MKLDNLIGLFGRLISTRVVVAALTTSHLLCCSLDSSAAETNVVMAGGLAVPSVGYSIPATSHAGGLQFNFNPIGDLSALLSGTPAQQALGNSVLQGFDDAGHLWSNIFHDPITVNVDIDYPALDPGVLGQASSQTIGATYTNVRTRLGLDATTADDATAVANLQTGASLEFLTNRRADGVVIRPPGTDTYTQVLDVNRANAKALGLLGGNHPGLDASIAFSSNFTWDFDHTNPIVGFDFVAVAAHEIGHALGFVSGVDTIDAVTANGPAAPPFDLNGPDPGTPDISEFRVFSVLDLFRYSTDSLNEPNQPATGSVLDLAYADTPYFSIDAGTTNLGTFSTGAFNGDGEQASHWKDNLGLGLMDPTLTVGTLGVITGLDVQALDVIGYDLWIVPEPTSIMLVAVGLMLGLASMHRRTA